MFEKGYTYVMVDLRGTGGSSGCNDWGGPGEQTDVKAAVEWAASREWSTGKVALLRQVLRRVDRADGARPAPRGPGGGGVPGAGGGRLPLPVHEPRAVPQPRHHPLAVPGDRRPAGPPAGRSDVPVQQRPHEPGLLRPQPQRPAESRPGIGLLEAARPRGRGAGQLHAHLPDGGLPRGQHKARRRLRAVEQPQRPQPRLVRTVGPHPRDRSWRRRQGAGRPRDLRRRGDGLPGPPREGRPLRAAPARRDRADQRRQLAPRGELAARGLNRLRHGPAGRHLRGRRRQRRHV